MARLSGDQRGHLDPGSSVLVYDSPFETPAGQACPLLTGPMAAGSPSVLAVLLTGNPERTFRAIHRSVDRRPERLRIVSVVPGSTPATTDSVDVVERVGSPGDLTKLGVEITKVLSAWNGEAGETGNTDVDGAPRETGVDGDGDPDIVVCFDSLTALLQYVDRDRAVRFVRELTNWFDDVNATAHVHVDPNAHGAQTMATLAPLFDDVVEDADSHAGHGTD